MPIRNLQNNAEKYFAEIESLGGVIPAIEKGYFQKEIALSASDYQDKIDSKKLIHVGVNEFIRENEKIEIPILEIGEEAEKLQKESLAKIRLDRDDNEVQKALSAVTDACKSGQNMMPLIIDAAKKFATMGEIVIAMKAEFGEWQETAVF